MRLLGSLAGWVRAGLEQLRRLMDAPMLWQGGFGALQATIEGWLAGSQGAAPAIASIPPIIGAFYGQGSRGEWDGPLPSSVYCMGVRVWRD